MSFMVHIQSCLLYITSCFHNRLDNPRKYSLDTDSIILDIDIDDDSRTELKHRISKHSCDPVYECGIGKTGGGNTNSDMSEIVPVIGGESEESTILNTFWRNIRGVIRDSIDEDDGFVVDMDTVIL